MRRLTIFLMLPGVILLGFLSWQHLAANNSQNEARDVITQSIEAQGTPAEFQHIVKRDTTKSEPVVKPKKIKVDGKYVEAVGLLSIPSIGVKNEPVVDDFSQAALDEGLIASMGTPPGEIGNFINIGHVVTHNEVYKNLKKLRKGDTVTVKTTTETFTYKIRGGPVTVKNTDTWPLRDVPSKRKNATAVKPVITLITCASRLFHTDDRIVVIGDLVKGTP